MELVLAHRNMDFDCLACQLAVSKLYPAARIVPAHPLSQRLKSFLSLYRDQLPLVDLQYVDWSAVRHVYIVDCQKLDRLDDRARRHFLEYSRSGAYTVFDHHETDPESLLHSASHDSLVKESGAAASILVEKLKEKDVVLSKFEATVIAAGIYEDTGCLTHRGSSELDALGIAYCLSQGADLERVNHIIRPKFDEWQVSLFEKLAQAAENIQLAGAKLTICTARSDRYIDGLSEISSRLLENSASDALVAIVEMKDRVHVVARSETAGIDLRALAHALGGGGHSGAASAVVKGTSALALKNKVIDSLNSELSSEKTAVEVMSTPVRTVRPDVSMDEAGRIMLRHSLDGMVVMDNDEVVGIVSKRDVDKARHHKLGHAPVRGFMSHPVISVRPQSRMSEIRTLMVDEDIGRLPVLDETGKLLGLVGRRELLAALYGDKDTSDNNGGRIAPRRTVSGTEGLVERIEPDLLDLYREIGFVASELKMVAYLVGGCVRDLILDRANFDLDFVVEGSARELANALVLRQPRLYELIVEHARFNTATLHVHTSPLREIDIATARTEYYEYPASLPTVEPSSLEQDLARRDFTINALALCLHPDRFGEIVDYFSGLADLNAGIVRVLHPFSFIEDPTRIVRAARFASRLGFRLDDRTKLQAERAIALGIFDNLGGVRLKEEMRLILESPERLAALDMLAELGGGLRFLDGRIIYDKRVRLHVRRAQKLLAHYSLDKHYVVYLGILLYQLEREALQQALMRLHLGDDERSWIRDAQVILAGFFELENYKRRSQLYKVLHGHDEHALAIAVCVAPPGSPLRRCIKLYFEELKDTRTFLRGRDLVELGIPQGPEIGKILDDLHDARLDGDLLTFEDERQFVYKNYASLIVAKKKNKPS